MTASSFKQQTRIMSCLVVLIWFLFANSYVFSEEQETAEDLFISTPEQIVTLRSEPSFLIGGLISPLSGQLVLRNTDLISKGAQNVILNRIYIPPHILCSLPKHKNNQEDYDKKWLYDYLRENYKGWQFYPHTRLQFNPHTREVRLSESNGITLDFLLVGPDYLSYFLPPYLVSVTWQGIHLVVNMILETIIFLMKKMVIKSLFYRRMDPPDFIIEREWQIEFHFYIYLKKKCFLMERSLNITIMRAINYLS